MSVCGKTKEEAVWPSGLGGSWPESDQAKGRHPVPFTPTSREIKVPEAITSAGTVVGAMLIKSLPATAPVAQSVCCLMTVGRSP